MTVQLYIGPAWQSVKVFLIWIALNTLISGEKIYIRNFLVEIDILLLIFM